MKELEKFVEIVRRLRDPEHGCPWDCAQDMMSLRRFLVEESGEYLDAVESGDIAAMKDELGDLLLQVVLNSQVASDEGKFTLEDVAASESAKMVRRHPHVFGDATYTTEAERRQVWEAVKSRESTGLSRKSAVDGVARSMPALMRAQKMSSKAARTGFEWPSMDDAFGKVREEFFEVQEAYASGDDVALEDELGDLLFAIAVFCRWKNFQAEEVLQKSIRKFERRFRRVESAIDLKTASLEEMLSAWKSAKAAVAEEDNAHTESMEK